MMILFALFLGFTMESKAQEMSVVDVRRNITLAEEDPVYKDFYIGGSGVGALKKNLVVTAVRKVNIRDASGANAVGEITVPVGQLKIIAVYDKVAVAREFTLLSRDELPMLEQIGIMNGDRVDIKGSFIDTSKPKKKKTVAETQSSAVLENVVVVVPSAATGGEPSAAPAANGPAPASLGAAIPAALPANPVVSAQEGANKALAPQPSEAKAPESLEKTADSGDNTRHE